MMYIHRIPRITLTTRPMIFNLNHQRHRHNMHRYQQQLSTLLLLVFQGQEQFKIRVY